MPFKKGHPFGNRFKKGHIPWSKGKTKEEDKRIAQPWLGKKRSKKTCEKISKSLKGKIPWNKDKRYKMKNPVSEETRRNISKALTGKKLTKEHIANMNKFPKGNIPWNKDKKTPLRIRKKISASKKGQVSWNKGLKGYMAGHENYVKDPEKRRQYARLGSLALFNRKGPTSIEKKIYEFLQSNSVIFEKQKLINNKFLVDAFIPEKNLIIECDGNYWHSLDKAKRKDKAENAYLAKCGFNMLRLKESEIFDDSFERKLKKWL